MPCSLFTPGAYMPDVPSLRYMLQGYDAVSQLHLHGECTQASSGGCRLESVCQVAAAVQAPNTVDPQQTSHPKPLPAFSTRSTLLYARFACATGPRDFMGKVFRCSLVSCRLWLVHMFIVQSGDGL